MFGRILSVFGVNNFLNFSQQILRLLRPTLAVHIEDILQQLIVPKIRESFEDWPKFNLQLREMKSCAQEPQLLGVKVHDRTSSGDIVLDLKYG